MKISLVKTQFVYGIFLILTLVACQPREVQSTISLVPTPQEFVPAAGQLDLRNGVELKASNDSLLGVSALLRDFHPVLLGSDPTAQKIALRLREDQRLAREAYTLVIDASGVEITGGSYAGVAHGITSMLQLVEQQKLPYITIKDQPNYPYRAVMLDVSRSWYEVGTIKQVINLCSWYKINYLQLHLTDDGLFTFPSTRFPKLASKNSYSLADLAVLNHYAHERGVTLVPEIDIPGHSSGFIRSMPALFGLDEVQRNPYTLNMGKEAVYAALEVIIGEVAAAFPHSPYIHLGGDEVFADGFEEDPHVQRYLKQHKLASVEELYRHFLARTTRMVVAQGRTPVLWNGFAREGAVEIPKDVVIMNWQPGEYTPQQMMDDGFTLINASWQPLYIVNNRKWSPSAIYQWRETEWRGSETRSTQAPLMAEQGEQLMGASMEIWEQRQEKAFSSLKKRLAAMSEVLWGTATADYEAHQQRVTLQEATLVKALFPFDLEEKGLYYPTRIEPNFSEDMWFDQRLTLQITPHYPDIELRYTTTGKMPTQQSALVQSPLELTASSPLVIQAFKEGEPFGLPVLRNYTLMPVRFEIEGLITANQVGSWEKHKFSDSMQVSLTAPNTLPIYYSLNGANPSPKMTRYTHPFTIKNSSVLKARQFTADGKPYGGVRSEEYEQLLISESLTTGKHIETSNAYEGGNPSLAVDGKISRWDHWGAHTNGNNWVVVDLGAAMEIAQFKVVTFWDGWRYYTYTISVSDDKEHWTQVVDQSQNTIKSTPEGQITTIEPIKARYLKLKLLSNSANPGLHLVEFGAYAP